MNVLDIIVKKDIQNIQTYTGKNKFNSAIYERKLSILNKVNKRIQDTKKYLEKNGLDTEFFESRLGIAKNVEGVIFSSDYRISTAKAVVEGISEKGLENLQKIIDTRSTLIQRAINYIKSASDEDEDDIDWEAEEEAKILARAGTVGKVYDDYNDAIQDFYHVKDNIQLDAIPDIETRESIRGKLAAVKTALTHPGTRFIGSSKVEENKKLISNALNDVYSLTGGKV